VAQKIQVLLVDDLDGGEAEGTVRFGLDGVEYEIDLNTEHAEALRRALAPFIGAARRSPAAGRRPVRGGRRAAAGGLDTTEVREWARAQGIEVKDRGRIPAEVVARFKAATGKLGTACYRQARVAASAAPGRWRSAVVVSFR
jgi:nucleoid-associated protein Lsr2